MKNKEKFISILKEKTNLPEKDCITIVEILEQHFIVGKNNKEKTLNDLKENLNVDDAKADEIYNIWVEFSLSNLINKKGK